MIPPMTLPQSPATPCLASPAPTLPPMLPPMFSSAWPSTLPPSTPPSMPSDLQPPLLDAAPHWEALCGNVTPSGKVSPTTCAGSELESTQDSCIDECSSVEFASEVDYNTDTIVTKQEELSPLSSGRSHSPAVPPPPGLDGCLCPWFRSS